MAKYTITVNERTKEGRALIDYLKALQVLQKKEKDTLIPIQKHSNMGGKDMKKSKIKSVEFNSYKELDEYFDNN